MKTNRCMKILKNHYVIASFLTVLLFGIYLLCNGILPFGENTILESDAFYQYSPFLSGLQRMWRQNEGIMLSWEMGLANSFFTTFAYYLASPFNLLVLFFEPNHIPIAIECIILLKLLCITNTMLFFIKKSMQYQKKEGIIFAIFYTFCAFTTTYLFHIMWLDALYMLPIVLYTIDQYRKNRKIVFMILALSYTIFVNYYMGYIVTGFSILYYLTKWGCDYTKQDWKQQGKLLGKFLMGIFLSVGINSMILLPTFMQNMQSMVNSVARIGNLEEILPLFSNIWFNTHSTIAGNLVANVFCGTLTIVCIPLYYINSSISKREKLCFTLLWIFLEWPIFSSFWNLVWHGMSIPNSFPFRYSFGISFILIYMAIRVLQNQKTIRKIHLLCSGFLFLVVLFIQWIEINFSQGWLSTLAITTQEIIIPGIFVIAFTLWIYLNQKKTNNKKVWLFLIILSVTDISVSIYTGSKQRSIYNTRRVSKTTKINRSSNRENRRFTYTKNGLPNRRWF